MEEMKGANYRRNILSVILLVVAVGAFVYFALTQKPKEIYTSSSNNNQLVITTESAGISSTNDGNMSKTTINSITSNSAVLNGSYVNGQNLSTWFLYGVDPNLLVNVGKTNPALQSSKSDNFSETVSNLGSNMEWFYRAVGQNSGGPLVYGQILTFKTKSDTTGQAPIVETSMENNDWQCGSNLTNENICLVGEFIGNGLPTKAWFEYGTTKSLGKSTAPKNVGTGYGDFKEQEYFKPGVQYYVRIAAKNSSGTTRGEIIDYSVLISK
ncbi:MAG TPA: hypothetical protein VMR49_01540 [Candidatus Paceibacterota bacterium]|nr:hypothetical protein [Candidatus Paceibacterota bacterium]